MSKTFYAILGLAAAAVILFAFNWYYSEPAATEPADFEPYRATLTGEYLCLPHVYGIPTEECAAGLMTDDGVYYAIDFALMSQIPPAIKAGDRITASGVVTPIERLSTDHWRRYPVVAIFSVTDSVTVLSN